MAEALYRKYRPQVFEDVVGQEQIERTIKNAIDQDKVSHAYLFCGPRGTGKTTTARLLAKALLCEKGPTPNPDGTCEDCQMIAEGVHPDVYELDAASRTGVENVREEIINRVQFAPTRGRYKVYIIDEVHMLSIAAFNALLKTLEEPPDHVVFILATTDPQKVPETIHSRCQRFDFRRISNESIVSRLGAVCVSEGVEFEGDALDLIAHHAGGGMRNALTSLEQMIAFGEGKVTLEVAERMLGGVDSNDLADIMRALGARDAAACFKWVAEYTETGADLAGFTRELAQHVRNLYVMSLTDATVAVEVSTPERRQLEAELPQFGTERLARMLCVLGDVMAELKTSTNPRLTFEIALTRMVRPEGDLTLAALAERVEALEAGGNGVAAPAAVAAPVPAQSAVLAGTDSVAAGQVQMPSGTGFVGASESSHAPRSGASNAAARAAQAAPAVMRGPAPTPAQAPQSAPAPAPRQIPNAPARTAPQQAAAPSRMAAQPAAAAPAPSSASQQAPAPVAAPASAPLPSPAAQQPVQQASAPSPQPAPSAQPTPQNQQTAGAANPQLAATFSNPAALQRVWQATLATLKRSKAAYGVLFLGTKASYDAASNMFNIEFPAENAFAFKAVQKPDVQASVGQALSQACGGQQVPFALTQAGSAATPRAVQVPAAGPGAAQTPAAVSAPVSRLRPESASQPQPQPASQSPTQQSAPQSAAPSAPATRPQPAPAPRPAPAPVPQVAPARAPQPRRAADVPPWEDEQVPYDDAMAVSFDEDVQEGMSAPSRPQTPAASRPQPAPTAAQAAQPQAPAPSPEAAAQPAQTGSGTTVDDLQSILQAGFGGGVTFEEVD
jgi:DNA polymerase III subunit gamma/tau